MEFSKPRLAGIAAATTAVAAYGVYRFRSTDDDSAPDEDAAAAA
jgi:hypothetical protein